MIEIPEDGWGADTPDISVALLGGTARPDAVFTIPDWAPAGEERASEPAADADSARERAGGVFRRQRSIGAFNRELDTLFASIAAAPDWSGGLERFDRKAEALRQRHAGDLNDTKDREAFARHAGEFAAMQRIGLKRTLTERQASEALTQLDAQLDYYASKAAGAGHDAFRQISTDSGLRAIDELREAGYLTLHAAEARKTAFLTQVEGGSEATAASAARAAEAAAQPMESLAEWPMEGATTPPDMAKELSVLLGPALVSILATPAGRLILQRLAPAAGVGAAKRGARPRSPRPTEESSPRAPTPGASSPPPRAKSPVVTPPDEPGRSPDKEPDGLDASEVQAKSAKEIHAARERWKERGFNIDHFGPIFEDLRGDWKAGVRRLLKEQDGEVPAALHHPEINESIDLIWGEAGTARGDGYGLAKIARFHPEVLDDLPEIVARMQLINRSANRIRLESPSHQAVVRLEFDGRKKTWLLTAFEKEDWALRSAEDGQAEPHGQTDSSATGPVKDRR